MEDEAERYSTWLNYKPGGAPIAQKATLGVKFSKDIFLSESFLKQREIDYKPEDLENTPMGWALRIKRP